MTDTKSDVAVKKDDKQAVAPATRNPFEDLRHEIDRLFEDFSRGAWLRPWRPIDMKGLLSLPTPAIDIVENDKTFKVTAELPGLDARKIDVTLKNGNLVIKGEKQEEKEEKSEGYYMHERQFGSFERSLPIPEGADPSKAEATYKNGVLTVVMPKNEAARKPATRIEVKTA